jgi:hypothetical protein
MFNVEVTNALRGATGQLFCTACRTPITPHTHYRIVSVDDEPVAGYHTDCRINLARHAPDCRD